MKKKPYCQCPLAVAVYAAIFPVFFMFSSVTLAHAVAIKGQGILDKKISLQVSQMEVATVLKKIEAQTEARFVYQAEVVSDNKISLNVKSATIAEILQTIFGSSVSYESVGNMVVLRQSSKADDSTVNGKVTDETGAPMTGVNVTEKGTTNGTMTDADGKFILQVTDESSVLVFSSIGYAAQEATVGNQSNFSISMQPDVKQLEEVVVVGYGTQVKKNVTGSISTVDADKLMSLSSASLGSQLSGISPGVVVNTPSAQPGANPQIIIRGMGTLTAGNNPLIVVDGFPLTEGSSLNSINSPDIQKVDILKDPASASIYGSRSANGVILVTTKKGKAGKPTIALDFYTGFQTRADNVKYVDAYDAATFFTEARDNGYISKDPARRSISDDRATRRAKGASLRELRLHYLQPYLDKQPGLTNTDWFGELFRKAPMSNYNLSISGGAKKNTYYFSANYFTQKGIAIGSDLNRYSSFLKLENELSDKLNMGFSLNTSYYNQTFIPTDADRDRNILGAGVIAYPFFKPYNDDGSFNISEQIRANTPEDGALGENPVATAHLVTNLNKSFRSFGNVYLEYAVLKDLKFKTLLGGDWYNLNYNYYTPSFLGTYRTPAPKPAVASETNTTNYNYLTENTLTYNKVFDKHAVNILAGYTYQAENGSESKVTGGNIADDNLQNIAGASTFTVNKDDYKWTQISYLARIQYAYENKYLLTATLRRDASSRFGNNKKWGSFPSVSLGWVLSNEKFYENVKYITFVKLRASWGMAGNNQIGNYSAIALVNGGADANYIFGNNLATGYTADRVSNLNLTWETKSSANFGFDLAFFNQINLSLDYYTGTTNDLLLKAPMPAQSGFVTYLENIGRVRNSGLEVELSTEQLKFRKWGWRFSAQMAANQNKVLALAPGQEQIIQGEEGNIVTKVGGPIAEIYGYKITGIFKEQNAVNTTPCLPGTLVGDYRMEDVNKDGKINTDDRIPIGTYNPKATYGFSSAFSYANFELSVGFNGVIGRTIFNRQLASSNGSGEGFAPPFQYYFDNRYHADSNPDGFFCMPNFGNFSSARKQSKANTLYTESGDYIRLRNLRLTYNIPASRLTKGKIKAARIYISGNNVFTYVKKYHGFNPEGTTENILTSGQAQSNYPFSKIWLIGCNLTF